MLTELQQRVVDAIRAGHTDYADIAEAANMGRTHARRVVRGLCKRYGVRLSELPRAVEAEQQSV